MMSVKTLAASQDSVLSLSTETGSARNPIRPVDFFYRLPEADRTGFDADERTIYTELPEESARLAPCKVHLAQHATEKTFMSYTFKLKRGDPFPDIFAYSVDALVSDRAKKVIEELDDPRFHQFYPSAILDRDLNAINDQPYWGWIPLRCLSFASTATVEEIQQRLVPAGRFSDRVFLPLLEHGNLFEKVSKIPFWRTKFTSLPYYLSEPSLIGMRKAGLTGLDERTRFNQGYKEVGRSIARIDANNLRINYEKSMYPELVRKQFDALVRLENRKTDRKEKRTAQKT
jgi:hypothetical protein